MSDKPGRSFFWLKLIIVAGIVAAAILGVRQYIRPIAKVEVVISGDAVDAKPGSVTVKEEYLMQMKTSIAGRVLPKDYNLDPGQKVKEGDILVQLDTADIQIAIDQDHNEYESSKQRIALGSSAKFALESANSDFKNTERLFKLGQISDSDYQKARRLVDTVKQQLALEDVRNEEDLKTDETTLRKDELSKEKMTIRAPFEGEVSYVLAHPGDLVDSGSPIVTLITTAREVQAKISEEDFANIKVGQKVSATFLPYGAWVYNGVVKKILPTADPETLRHLIDLTITDIPAEKLIPGITGEVSIEVGRRHANAIIPRRAILNDNVYVVKDGKVELRPIKTGYVWLTGVEVLEGLEPGEAVIVEDLDSFRAGDGVKVEELPSDAISKKK
jgi:RND family efflux transporter MFP subunit